MNKTIHEKRGSVAKQPNIQNKQANNQKEYKLPKTLLNKVDLELRDFDQKMKEGLLSCAVNIGLEVMNSFIEAEVTEIAGPKGHHDEDRKAYRHGVEDSKVPLGGRMIDFKKPRVRKVDKSSEVTLSTWQMLATEEVLDAHTLISMLAGVSSRNYRTLLEPMGQEIANQASSISKSAVSRRFVAATKDRLEKFRSRSLADNKWVVIYIDGFGFKDETLVGALGIDSTGNKMPLSVIHGTTENKTICKTLLDDLESRGLDASDGILFVIDGSKAIYYAIKDKWGDHALIQRCRAHKKRNILDLIPQSDHHWVKRELNAAWNKEDVKEAEKALLNLVKKIGQTHPDAASSLKEGIKDTITVNALGVKGPLLATVSTTNPIESMINIIKTHSRNVKRWQAGDMQLRWAAAGMIEAEKQFIRVKGYRDIHQLQQAIKSMVNEKQNIKKAS